MTVNEVNKIVHPAQYSEPVVRAMVETLDTYDVCGTVLDPFAGPGQWLVHFVGPKRNVVGIEIQPEWVDAGRALLYEIPTCDVELREGDATHTGLADDSIAAVCTSPCYGNRFADHHNAKDNSRRRSYTHDLRTMTGDMARTLAANSAGSMPFGSYGYDGIHRDAWREMFRVTKPGGLFLLNVSDFIRNKEVVRVTAWHRKVALDIGWKAVAPTRNISTRRMRYGENHGARVAYEKLFVFTKPIDSEIP